MPLVKFCEQVGLSTWYLHLAGSVLSELQSCRWQVSMEQRPWLPDNTHTRDYTPLSFTGHLPPSCHSE